MCVCVCVCVCARGKEGDRGTIAVRMDPADEAEAEPTGLRRSGECITQVAFESMQTWWAAAAAQLRRGIGWSVKRYVQHR